MAASGFLALSVMISAPVPFLLTDNTDGLSPVGNLNTTFWKYIFSAFGNLASV
ncbi:hypothetical protein D3C85_1542510 [compost metagenome]